jgi:hypothetical protein
VLVLRVLGTQGLQALALQGCGGPGEASGPPFLPCLLKAGAAVLGTEGKWPAAGCSVVL